MTDTIQVPVRAALVAVDGRTYPLEAAQLVARAEGGVAFSTLVQRFANPHAEALEVQYTLPLPVDGAVLGYTVRVGERVIRGEVQPRERASTAYHRALAEGRTAGLLEESRPDTFQQQLGNVPPGTAVEVTIEVLHPLEFLGAAAAGEGPQWEYRFPTVVGPRYLGAPGRVPDGAELTPDRDADGGIPTRLALQLTIADASAAGAVRSPSHALAVTPEAGGVGVAFTDGERLDRDVVVRWDAAAAEVGVRFVEGGGLAGDDGRYALVTLVPPVTARRTWGRDLTLLVDASGSMSGEPLELARRVAGELLRSLGAGDRFELIAFAFEAARLTEGFLPAEPAAIERGLELLARLQAAGGTEMVEGIAEAMRSARGDAQRQVVLLTDGQVGFEDEVVAKAADAANVRLHAVGVGHAPNRSLTRRAAHAGRGLELLVTNEGDAHRAAARLVAATASPVLTGLEVRGRAIAGPHPTRLRDVFAGRPLLFTVELSPSGGTLDLRGTLAGESWRQSLVVPPVADTAALVRTPLPLGALHGRTLVDRLELTAARGRIERVAMRHRIVSRETSLVAIAEEPGVEPGAPRRRERLAVELPAGVSAEGAGMFVGGAFMASYERPAMMKGGIMYRARLAPARSDTILRRKSAARAWVRDDFETMGPDPQAPEPPSRTPEPPRIVSCEWLAHDRLLVEFESWRDEVWFERAELVLHTAARDRSWLLGIEGFDYAHPPIVTAGGRLQLVLEVKSPKCAEGEAWLEVTWYAMPEPYRQVTALPLTLPPRPAPPAGESDAT